MAAGRRSGLLGATALTAVLAACTTGQTSEPVTCVGGVHVSTCSQGESDSRWLAVDDVRPGTAVTWTLGGETLSRQVPNSEGPLRIDLPDRSEAPLVQVVVEGTGQDGRPFRENVSSR